MAQMAAFFSLIGQFIQQSLTREKDEPYVIFDFFDVENKYPSIFGGNKEKRRAVKELYASRQSQQSTQTTLYTTSRANRHNLTYKPNGCL